MAKRRARKAKVERADKAKTGAKESQNELLIATAVLVFGAATAYSAVTKMGNWTILLGLATALAALALTLKK